MCAEGRVADRGPRGRAPRGREKGIAAAAAARSSCSSTLFQSAIGRSRLSICTVASSGWPRYWPLPAARAARGW